MRITYDDMYEFSQVVRRCADTAQKGKCMWCPFWDCCMVDEGENRQIMCGEIAKEDHQ